MQQKFLELVEAEVRILQYGYQAHQKRHVLDVMEERKQRNLKTDDLENHEFFSNKMKA
jgi:hypothetical protein